MLEIGGELMPGVPLYDLPRRPLIVHAPDYATTYDMVTCGLLILER